MSTDLCTLMRDPKMIPYVKQSLLSQIADQAASLGMPSYLVGGFVRDLLLKQPVNDYDIVVEGDAIKLGEALVKKFGGKLTPHYKFHTAIWHIPPLLNNERSRLDLITARTETYSQPGMLPTISPASIDDDLRRRDFTINAMAVRLDGDDFGALLDPLGGLDDLSKKLIRVLHPDSFIEDPTRIFRSVRYEQRYGFKITSQIGDKALETLSSLSGDRIRHEFDLILKEENSASMLARLYDLGIFGAFDPPLPGFNERYSDLLNAIPPVVFGVLGNRIVTGYLLWLIDSKVEAVASLAERLNFSSELRQVSISAIQLKNDLPSLKSASPSLLTFKLEKIPLIVVYVLWLVSEETVLKEFLVRWRYVKQKTTGNDLKAYGLVPSPRFTEILTRLRAAWLDGEIVNDGDERELLESLL